MSTMKVQPGFISISTAILVLIVSKQSLIVIILRSEILQVFTRPHNQEIYQSATDYLDEYLCF